MGIARRAASLLRESGFDTVHLGDRGLCRLPDEDITVLARDEGRIIVTLDADFSAILALSGATHPSVIHLRIEGLRYREAARLIATVAAGLGDELEHGCIASVTEAGIRLRRLPIVRAQ
jgi:predicted nuclease of predicted toxin-antitoxin system